jgi:hypothetical protein
MANFRTHATIGAVSSVVIAAVIYSTTDYSIYHLILFIGLGMFGGILPDVDSDRSSAINLVFNIVTGFLILCVIALYFDTLPWYVLAALTVVILLVVRFGVKLLFAKLTVHRGNFHSILAAVMFALATAAVSKHLFYASDTVCWLNAMFIGSGYLVHLILDEIYAVDLDNIAIKRSFGSALKLFSMRYPVSALLSLLLVVVSLVFSPIPNELVPGIFV